MMWRFTVPASARCCECGAACHLYPARDGGARAWVCTNCIDESENTRWVECDECGRFARGEDGAGRYLGAEHGTEWRCNHCIEAIEAALEDKADRERDRRRGC